MEENRKKLHNSSINTIKIILIIILFLIIFSIALLIYYKITKITNETNDNSNNIQTGNNYSVSNEPLRKENITLKIPVVYNSNIALNNDKTISSSIFSPGVAGLYLAYFVINDIINKK